MANGNNKGYSYMDDFVVSLEILIEQLQAARDEAAPKLERLSVGSSPSNATRSEP